MRSRIFFGMPICLASRVMTINAYLRFGLNRQRRHIAVPITLERVSLPHDLQCPNNANAILFTTDTQVIRQEMGRGRVYNPSEEDDDSHCLFFNHGEQITTAKRGGDAAGHAMRPTTSARSTRRLGRGAYKSIQDNVGDLKTEDKF